MSIKIIITHGVKILNHQTTIFAVEQKHKKIKKRKKIKKFKKLFFSFKFVKIKEIEK